MIVGANSLPNRPIPTQSPEKAERQPHENFCSYHVGCGLSAVSCPLLLALKGGVG
ncbi:MAG: hypothetical protein HQL69_23800 [Magnetococcales bacterium]|nr:hypothetical protein [Magnetococcales bacterium]